MLSSQEYRGYYATFFLKRRREPRRWLGDPVEREYRWWIAYFCTTESDMERRVQAWRPYAKRSKSGDLGGFYKQVVNDPEVEVALPAHNPLHYTDFAETLGGEVRYYVKDVRLAEGGRVSVTLPVIKFGNDSAMYKHILFATTLATFKNPTLYAQRVAVEVLRRPSWSEIFGLGCCDRFREVRYSNYTSSGFWWVLRVGMAFAVLSRIKVKTRRRKRSE